MNPINSYTIVGLGKVGGALFNLISSDVEEVNFDLEIVRIGIKAVHRTEIDSWISSWLPAESTHVIVLAVPAHAIQDVVSKMSALDLRNTLVVHTNGSMQPDVLAPLQKCGAMVAATHPYQTFADDDPGALDGIAWGVECEEGAWELTNSFLDEIGGFAVHLGTLTPDQKRIYHASAVAASNFSYAAYSLARKLADNVHLDAATFLSPIIERTMLNATRSIEMQEPFNITGPLARGDEQAVVDQLNALPAELRRTYAECSLGLLDAVSLNEQQKSSLRTILMNFVDK